MRKDDLVGRILGILVFLGGVALLALVFAAAYGWFTSPGAGLQTAPVKGSAAPVTAQLGQSAMYMFIKIALLIVMAIVGSLLAGRGAQLYFAAANAGRRPSIAPSDEDAL